MLDRLRDLWDKLGPRERRLAGWLGVVVAAVSFLYVGFLISGGLADLEDENDNTRLLLATLEQRRDSLIAEKSKQGDAAALITEEAPALGTYVEKIAKENNLQIRASTEKPLVTKGKYHELANQITLYDVTVDDFARFVKGLETTSPIVVTQILDLKRSAIQKEKLDRVDITLATYARAKPKAEGKPGEAAPAGGEAKP